MREVNMENFSENFSQPMSRGEEPEEFTEIRHCDQCGNRLTQVIRGMSQPGDELLEHEYLEFVGGCIVYPEDEDWYCKKCGAKVFE